MTARLIALAAAMIIAASCDATNGAEPDEVPQTSEAGAASVEDGADDDADASAEASASLPFYVDETGAGILRYSPPNGEGQQYWVAIVGVTGNPDRPREVIGGGVGPFEGPHLAVYYFDLMSIVSDSLPLEDIRFDLYQQPPGGSVAELHLVVEPARAETLEDCGEVDMIGTCSNRAPPAE